MYMNGSLIGRQDYSFGANMSTSRASIPDARQIVFRTFRAACSAELVGHVAGQQTLWR
jgi:hypothetical protein